MAHVAENEEVAARVRITHSGDRITTAIRRLLCSHIRSHGEEDRSMTVASFEGKTPAIGAAPTSILGRRLRRCRDRPRRLDRPGARIRGDYGAIRIGDATSVEDTA